MVANGATCVGVVWDSVMNLKLVPPKNCFLKGASGGFVIAADGADISAGALLVS